MSTNSSVPSAPMLAVLADLRDRLQSQREALLRSLPADVPIAMDASAEVSDRKEQAELVEESELQDARQTQGLQELAEIEAALQRLARGSYGLCVDCRQPIALQRLMARPEVIRCTACQAQAEAAAQL